jgi:hypothetical protein
MSTQSKLNDLDWRKASASGNNGCIEVAPLAGGDVAVRDSKLGPDSPILTFHRHEFAAFVSGVLAGEFDTLM